MKIKGAALNFICMKQILHPGGNVFPRKTCPSAILLPGVALALLPQTVKVRMQQQLLAGQPLRRVHPQTTLIGANHGNHQNHCSERLCFVPLSCDSGGGNFQFPASVNFNRLIKDATFTFMRLRAWLEMFGYFCSRGSCRTKTRHVN